MNGINDILNSDREVAEIIRRMNCLEDYAKEICKWIPGSGIEDLLKAKDLLMKFYEEFKYKKL